jgi:hypothetical protein
MTELNKDEFNAAVQAEVERILSSREEAQAREEAEAALTEAKETFETLKASLEAKDAKIKEYEEALAALDISEPTDAEVAANERIVELEKELEEQSRIAEVAQAALDTLAREETGASRMSELAEADVALTDESAEAQYAKVRDMSDEDFASYKSELIAVKSMHASPSEEGEEEEELEVTELSEQEVSSIAQSLGCDPADSKCISLVNEVAQKVAEVSNNRRKPADETAEEAPEEIEEPADEEAEETNKETASEKLSLGDAIARSTNQEIQANASLRDECAQAWENVYAEKHGKNTESE